MGLKTRGKAWLIACLILGAILVGGAVFGGIPKVHTNGESQASYQDISAPQYDEAVANRNPYVVDVHIPEQPHLPGTDAFIPYNQVTDRLAEFPEDKNTEILVYCRSGSMSAEASQALVDAGFTNVKNLVGGVLAWQEAHQELVINPRTRDLGVVIYGDVVRTQFSLTNNTDNPVKIARVSTSCSCTQAEVEKTSLGPHESIPVRVSFDPAVHKDDSDLGEVTKTIYVETDNPGVPKLEAAIEATVVKKS